MTRFTSERRERLLTLLETGRTVEASAASVGVNPTTVQRWAARGRAGVSPAESEFAERYDAIRRGDGDRLSEDDVVRALEQGVRKGSVTAMKALLVHLERQAGPRPAPADLLDELEQLPRRKA